MNFLQPPAESMFTHLGILYTPSFEQVLPDRRQEDARRQTRSAEGQSGESNVEPEKTSKAASRQIVDIAEMQSRSRLEEKDMLSRMKSRQESNAEKARLIKEKFKRVHSSAGGMQRSGTKDTRGSSMAENNASVPGSAESASIPTSKASDALKSCQTLGELEERVRAKLKALLMSHFSSRLAQPEATNADLLAEIFAPTMATHINESNKQYIARNASTDLTEFSFGSEEYIKELMSQLQRLFRGYTALGPEYRPQKIMQFSKATLKQLRTIPSGHEWE